MEEYHKDDPVLEAYSEKLSPYTSSVDSMGVPYWIYIHEKKPVGIVVVGQEPIQLIEPVGTPMSVIYFIDFGLPLEVLKQFARLALEKAKVNDVSYSFVDLSSEHKHLVEYFQEIGYTEVAHSKRMFRPIKEFDEESQLRAERAKREDALELVETMKEFMSGSPDVMLNIILDNIKELPERIFDFWFSSSELYQIFDGEMLVGFLDLSPGSGINISNMGVSPELRGKGYGRQILRLALLLLKKKGIERAGLRVHVDNSVAINLYESLGFETKSSYHALIWRKQ